MTDTGQVPAEGLPENDGLVEQPGMPAPGAYAFLDPAAGTADDDDLLLMPGSQGAWTEPQPGVAPAPPVAVPMPHAAAEGTPAEQAAAAAQDPFPAPAEAAVPPQGQAPGEAPVPHAAPAPPFPTSQSGAPSGAYDLSDAHETGAHEAGGRDSGSVDLGAVRMPPPAPATAAVPPQPRRPLHMGPPMPEATGGVVRSLADRGPATMPQVQTQQQAATQTQAHVQVQAQAHPPMHAPFPDPAPLQGQPPATAVPDPAPAGQVQAASGPEYLDAPEPAPLPQPQFADIPPQGAEPWSQAPAHPESQQSPYPHGAVAAAAETVVPDATGQFVPVDGSFPVPAHLASAPAVAPDPDAAQPQGLQEQAPVPAQPTAPEDSAQYGTAAQEPADFHVVAAAPPEPAEASVPEPAPEQQAAPQPGPVDAEAAEPQAAPAAPDAEAVEPQPVPAAGPVPPPQAAPQGEALAEPQAAEPAAEQPAPAVPAPHGAAAPDDGPDSAAPGPVAARTPAEAPAATGTPAEQVQAAAGTPEPTPAEPVEALAQAPVPAEAAVPDAPVPAEAPAPEAPVSGDAPAQAAAAPVEDPAHGHPATEEAPQPAPAAPAVDPTAPAHAGEPVTAETAGAAPTAEGANDAQSTEEPAAAAPASAGAPQDAPTAPPAPAYADAEREAVLRVMRERRDIRNGFRSDPIPHEVLLRVLEAAHTAPSVGHSQPWDFVVIRSAETRRTMHELAQRQREAYARSLPKGRAKQFKELKIEAILDTPVNIVVTADPTRGGRHTLGRHTQPQMAPYSSALAVENLWLAARAEGLGVGWVSFFDEREMVRALGLPDHLEVVAYLCVGYVDAFPDEPELMQAGWSKRRPLSWVVHEETYGRRALPGEEPHDLLQETVANIRPLDAKALGEAWERQKRMTKPAGALGMLEIISAQLAGLSRTCPPPVPEPAAVAIFAGDHGVHAQGVTAWPQEVTGQMVANFLGGGAVCNAFANQVGAEVCVVDVGVAADLPATPGLLPRKVRPGTADFTTGPALTREEVLSAIEVGIETARDLVAAGNKAVLTGEMGIANTTASAALISVYTGADPVEVTGRGTGINDEMHARKVDVVRRALDLHQPDPADPIGVLAAVGGLEHAALVGFILGGASLRTPVVLDGVSAGAAALVARAIAPESLAACIAGHRSAEPGHVAALNKLGLRPLVDLDLRLGEGTGALLALPLVQSAARAMHEVATFDAAGVTEK
ncbi:5,6-dimethylbenzimidazole synthase [Streptomyces sp. CC53]|uniref:nicotinate-nucleotide--dimethylbenzimidazole phosphoribosyltransferase n=1 Tax=unclassified Streptomyces TaxID=2593676 RepID=UPI0008DDFE02|nr:MULTISPECIES: nicotinate-nucleotide--dimethylbenzimidazole phosphoribosyltransferase [unclassified Streptomyces]OII64170.1 5,6-dimethylbenzimidazole synthase [Streptomyces sp. CC53]